MFCIKHRVDSRFAPCQWETALLCNDVSHWLGASLWISLKHIPLFKSPMFNTLSSEQNGPYFADNIFKRIILNVWILNIVSLKCVSDGLIENKSTLVQLMVWCCQATIYYLNQCWPMSVLPYGINEPQWVKWLNLYLNYLLQMVNWMKLF